MTTDPRAPEDVPLNRWGFIPPWAPLLVMMAVVFTGIVLGEVGTVFLVMFFLASIVCTALVELRGLFLTVIAIPFYWFIGIGLIGVMSDSASLSGSSRKTAILTAVFPAVESYLWLVSSFIISLLIAVIRIRLDTAARARAQRIARARRRRYAEADEDNRRVTTRVRELERTGGRRRAEDRPDAPTVRRLPRTVSRPRSERDSEEVRTRTAAELRAASERRRSREDLSGGARHRHADSSDDQN